MQGRASEGGGGLVAWQCPTIVPASLALFKLHFPTSHFPLSASPMATSTNRLARPSCLADGLLANELGAWFAGCDESGDGFSGSPPSLRCFRASSSPLVFLGYMLS
jgi:hypothetical protein